MLLTVTGIFRERTKLTENIRSFQRTLVIVPSGTGFCIKNEMVHISNATMVQIKTAFKLRPQPSPAPPLATAAPSSAITAAASTDDATKVQMVQLMSQRSNMNLEWSEK